MNSNKQRCQRRFTLCSSLQAIELIKQLAEANKYQIDSATTEDTIKVYQLFRVMPYEGLEAMWTQLAGDEEHRWVLGKQTLLEELILSGTFTQVLCFRILLSYLYFIWLLPDFIECSTFYSTALIWPQTSPTLKWILWVLLSFNHDEVFTLLLHQHSKPSGWTNLNALMRQDI